MGKQWQAQCSPEADLNSHVEPNENHVTVGLARPRIPRGTQQVPHGGVPSQ